MSFDMVPADLVLKIFHQLPLKDRVRLSGVNRLFRDISMESIDKMKSLVVNEDLEMYSIRTQTLWSVLESCSPTLQSIDVSGQSCPKSFLIALMEFCYPKLGHLEIRVRLENAGKMKRLIIRNRNLRSITLHLNCVFEWPEDVDFERMEKLEIIVWRLDGNSFPWILDVSPTLLPLIGKIPNLKRLTIKYGVMIDPRDVVHISLSAQELSQLLASIPSLEEMYLDLSSSALQVCLDGMAAIPTWNVPKLTTLQVDTMCWPIFDLLPASFPRLESFTSNMIHEVMDREIVVLSELKHLRQLCLKRMTIMKAEIIDLMTNVPSMAALEICKISDVDSSEAFIDFLTSAAVIFPRHLEIRMSDMSVNQINSELEYALEEIEENGGPTVTYEINGNSLRINSISCKLLAG